VTARNIHTWFLARNALRQQFSTVLFNFFSVLDQPCAALQSNLPVNELFGFLFPGALRQDGRGPKWDDHQSRGAEFALFVVMVLLIHPPSPTCFTREQSCEAQKIFLQLQEDPETLGLVQRRNYTVLGMGSRTSVFFLQG
jgi:hypothetical protein